jgi:hypothetical protein
VILQNQIVNRNYIDLLLRMGKTVVGVEAWNNRGNKSQGKLEEMLLITDEVLIAWTVDGHYNGWCDLYKTRYVRRDGRMRGKFRESDEGESCPTETDGETVENKMEGCKQAASVDKEDWLNYQRPRCGCWFIKRSMDEGYTKRNGGTTELGKSRWNEWGGKIAVRRSGKTSTDCEVREKYIAFTQAFQVAWKEMYGGTKSRQNGRGVEHEVKKVTAFNGIGFSV